MATDAQTSKPTSTANESSEWSQSDYIPSLKRLQEIHEQIADLRTILPNLLSSLTPALTLSPNNSRQQNLAASGITPSPAQVYADFAANATTAVTAVEKLKKEWQTPETERILSYAREQEAKGEDLNFGDRGVAVWDGGLGIWDGMGGIAESNIDHGNGTGESGITKTKDVARLVEDFRKKHPSFDVRRDTPGTIDISLSAGQYKPHFKIRCVAQDPTRSEQWPFEVDCVGHGGKNELVQSIKRCLAGRERKQDLHHTLEMIASYADLHTAKCVKCNNLLGDPAVVTTFRRPKNRKTPDGDYETQWEALHERCVE